MHLLQDEPFLGNSLKLTTETNLPEIREKQQTNIPY
jgi:hypothetical protein